MALAKEIIDRNQGGLVLHRVPAALPVLGAPAAVSDAERLRYDLAAAAVRGAVAESAAAAAELAAAAAESVAAAAEPIAAAGEPEAAAAEPEANAAEPDAAA